MTLIALKNAELAFGLTPLLDGASIAIQAGDRVGLIGRNGTGKSSLLGTLVGTIPLDNGEVQRRPGLSIASVEQEPQLPPAQTLRESLVLRGDFANMHDERALWAREARLNEYPAALLGKPGRIARLGVGRRTQARRTGAGVRAGAGSHAAR